MWKEGWQNLQGQRHWRTTCQKYLQTIIAWWLSKSIVSTPKSGASATTCSLTWNKFIFMLTTTTIFSGVIFPAPARLRAPQEFAAAVASHYDDYRHELSGWASWKHRFHVSSLPCRSLEEFPWTSWLWISGCPAVWAKQSRRSMWASRFSRRSWRPQTIHAWPTSIGSHRTINMSWI